MWSLVDIHHGLALEGSTCHVRWLRDAESIVKCQNQTESYILRSSCEACVWFCNAVSRIHNKYKTRERGYLRMTNVSHIEVSEVGCKNSNQPAKTDKQRERGVLNSSHCYRRLQIFKCWVKADSSGPLEVQQGEFFLSLHTLAWVLSRPLTPSSTQDVDPHPAIRLHPLVPQQPSWPQQHLCWTSSHRPSRQKHWKPFPDRRRWSRRRRPPRPRLTRLLSLLLLFSLVSLLPTSLSFSFSSESGLTSPSS